jgi:competence transcription factor ComK
MMAYYLPNLSVEQHRCIRLNVQYISSGSCCHFQHSGLSDGTRDQLYLALRLAALELHLEQAMPLHARFHRVAEYALESLHREFHTCCAGCNLSRVAI